MPRASLIAQLVKNPPTMPETWVWFLGQEDPLEKGKATHSSILGLPLWLWWSNIRLQFRRPGFDPWVGKITWRSERLSTPVLWPGEFHGLYSPWGHKESDTTKRLSLPLSCAQVERHGLWGTHLLTTFSLLQYSILFWWSCWWTPKSPWLPQTEKRCWSYSLRIPPYGSPGTCPVYTN